MNSAFAVFLLNTCRYILLKTHLFVLSANRLSKNIQNFISSDLKQTNKTLKLFKALKGLGLYCVEFTQSWNFPLEDSKTYV